MTTKEDTLIIGGGVIGVCAAYFLAKQGRSVTVLERDELSSGSSYGNAGLIAVDHAIPMPSPGVLSQGLKWMLDSSGPFYIKPRLDPDLIRWLWRFRGACKSTTVLRAIPVLLSFAQASLDLYEQLHADYPLDDGYQRKGRLFLYRTQSGLDHSAEDVDLLYEFGVRGRVLDAAAVREMFPNVLPSVIGGIYYENYAHFVPDRFVRELARVAETLGVRFCTETEVLSFETSGRRISKVNTTRGDFKAEEVVLAAGVWSAPIARSLGLRLPIQAAKGYSITAKRPPNYPELPVQLADDMVAVTPMAEFLRFSSTLEMSGLDMSINQRRLAASRDAMRVYLSGAETLEELEIWRGFRPMSPDDFPMIGRSGAFWNLTLATAHSMAGMTQGPITGKLVAQIIADEQPDFDLIPFSPLRF